MTGKPRRSDAEDEDSVHVVTVGERLEDAFLCTHMKALWFSISVAQASQQRLKFRAAKGILDTDDERDTREEFEIELFNLHDLLTNQHMRSIEVMSFAYESIYRYATLWRGAVEAIDRWWLPRQDKQSAVHADLQLVVPGLWIGSSVTIKPHNQELLHKYKIRHVIHCKVVKPDVDGDFFHGAQRALEVARGLHDAGDTSDPILTTSDRSESFYQQHTVALSEMGQMEFLVRRREKTLPSDHNNKALATICEFLHGLVETLRKEQQTNALCDQQRLPSADHTMTPYIDELDGILLYCGSGISTSITVCVAFLMDEYWLPYEIALRLVQCARRYVAPSEVFEHQLREYGKLLASKRMNQRFPKFDNEGNI